MADGISIRSHHYSIVALGAMNPRIHHPNWYNMIGAISEEEQAAAVASPQLMVLPPFARFQVGDIIIACQETRWEIVTTSVSSRPRILHISSMVFEKLYETPISAFGMNTNLDIETPIGDVAKSLAERVATLGFGFDAGGKTSATFSFTRWQNDRKCTIELRPSQLSEEVLFFGYNTEFKPKADKGYFNFGALVTEHFEADYMSAMDAASQAANSLKANR